MRDFILQNIELSIIPMVNKSGREKVDDGYNCWRSNGDKIDPNRNWAYGHRVSSEEDVQLDSNGDNNSFTIPETVAVNKAIQEDDPHVFLDVHSGMKGLMYPNGFQTEQPMDNMF